MSIREQLQKIGKVSMEITIEYEKPFFWENRRIAALERKKERLERQLDRIIRYGDIEEGN